MKKVLFVCYSNICRSPAAEAMMRKEVLAAGLAEDIKVDSAALDAHHAGEMVDVRMRNHLSDRGFKLDTRARRFREDEDFEKFDYIVVMDHDNLETIHALDTGSDYIDKIHLLSEYCINHKEDVPDPLHGEDHDFDVVLDILEDGIKGLFKIVKNNTGSNLNKKLRAS